MTLVLTVVAIPLALVWFCGAGQWWARHYFAKLDCELTAQTLRYRKGILFQVEKTIPLENIQDVTFIEGPLLKRFNLSVLKFETAGQGAGSGNEMKLVGIIDAHEFREQILSAREHLKHRHAGPSAAISNHMTTMDPAQVDALHAIQRSLDEITGLLKERLPK